MFPGLNIVDEKSHRCSSLVCAAVNVGCYAFEYADTMSLRHHKFPTFCTLNNV